MTAPAAPANGLTPLQQAALALKEMRLRVDRLEAKRREPVAIVGPWLPVSRAPTILPGSGACSRRGGDAVAEVPPDRWDADGLLRPRPRPRRAG